MSRAPLLALAGCAVLAAGILLWPPSERDSPPEGLLPAAARPRLATVGAVAEDASAAARQIRFVAPGAVPDAMAADANAAAAPEAPPPPPADLLPILVGVVGDPQALTGYFSSKGQSFRARQGGMIDGWRVAALGRRDARLVRGRRQLKVSLFSARSGYISPPMARVERPAYAPPPQPAGAAATPTTAPTPAAGENPPPVARRPRAPPPPPPKGSKGYYIGPPGTMPPGYVPYPGT